MKITGIEAWREDVPLTRPYTIARKTTSAVELFFVEVVGEEGLTGLGSASPSPDVTGESPAACGEALRSERTEFLVGRDVAHLGANLERLREELSDTPAARAALDMALHDLFARSLDVPLVDLLGRRHDALSTSITIGITTVEDTLEQAREYLGRGFRCLKVKLGHSIDEDIERLTRLRDLVGDAIAIRVDANEGYDLDEALRVARLIAPLGLELVEQPMPRPALEEMRHLPESFRSTIALDESLQTDLDAIVASRPPFACATFVVKLMKCGGVSGALRIAAVAEATARTLMWGCMDESAVSIAAALHTAYATPATRYLDLDGSFDLAHDPMVGGFRVEEGVLLLEGGAGLGVRRRE